MKKPSEPITEIKDAEKVTVDKINELIRAVNKLNKIHEWEINYY